MLGNCEKTAIASGGRSATFLPMPRIDLFAAIGVAAVIASSCAGRPNAAARNLPVPLVNALVNQGMDDAQGLAYTVDTIPSGYPSALRPSGAIVVGGMRTMDNVVVIFADSSRQLAPIVESLLEAHGFKRPPATPASGFSGGYGPGAHCSDSAMVTVAQLSGSSRHLVRVDYRPLRGYSCAAFERRPTRPELRLPGLTAPAGVRVVGSGGGRSSDGVNSRGELYGTRVVPSSVLKHYADQLVAAGWTAGLPAISDRVAAQFFEAITPEGDRWEGVLMVAGGGSSARLSLDMRRP